MSALPPISTVLQSPHSISPKKDAEEAPKTLFLSDHKFIFIAALGKGGNSSVNLYKEEQTSEEVAVKSIYLNKMKPERLKREISILKKLEHPSMIRFKDVVQVEERTHIITEYVPGSIELREFVQQKGQIDPDTIASILSQLVNVLKYCHSKNIAHRDLKPANILIEPNACKVKLIDFGLAREVPKTGIATTKCGTLRYSSPESLKSRTYDLKKSDVWSLGVTVYFMAAGRKPFDHSNDAMLTRMIIGGYYSVPFFVENELAKLIRTMLDPNPLTRISLEKITEHAFANKYRKYFPAKYEIIPDYFSQKEKKVQDMHDTPSAT